MNFHALADLLFPEVTGTVAELEKRFPERGHNNPVTRVAPSPTGFLHLGTVYTALINERFAHENNGVFFLRIEDTDDKREVQGAAQTIRDGLHDFGLDFNEGPIGEHETEIGSYGPYTQSLRKDIYQICAKDAVQRGQAYPCFLTDRELEVIRLSQQAAKVPTGVYGRYATSRNLSLEEIRTKIAAGEPWTLRLLVPETAPTRVTLTDLVRGTVEMHNNYTDIVLLKTNGIPTYHFAHCVDDHFMRTTHVIRADEWFASLPLHTQLFEMMQWKAPAYAHISPLMKTEGGSKRKLSKRKDPEANVAWFYEKGYPNDGVMEYLINIANSRFEDWKKENTGKSWKDFHVNLSDMNPAGSLTDLLKISSVCQEFVSKMSNEELFAEVKVWAAQYHPELAKNIELSPELAFRAITIERGTPKDPKRYTKWEDVWPTCAHFFDAEWEKALPEAIKDISEEQRAIVADFITDALAFCVTPAESEEVWFASLKETAKKYKFAENNQQFKEGGYIGKIGDAAALLRIGVLASRITPNLWYSLHVLGKDRVHARLTHFRSIFQK